MKEYKEVSDLQENAVFDDELNDRARQGWKVVPGCYHQLVIRDDEIVSFALMEREIPEPKAAVAKVTMPEWKPEELFPETKPVPSPTAIAQHDQEGS